MYSAMSSFLPLAFPCWGLFRRPIGLISKRAPIRQFKMDPEQEATNLLGMLPQHHRTKLACYLVRGLSAVDLCTLDTSLNANSFDPDTQDRLGGHGVDAGGAGVGYQVEYHETQGSLAQERCLMAVSFLCKRN
jgi:hypothetical protein